MKFDRITENQSYERIVNATRRLRSFGTGFPFIDHHPDFVQFKFDYQKCVTSGFSICGQGEYEGFIVTGKGSEWTVVSVFVDTLCPDDSEIKVWAIQGSKLDPTHAQCDIRKSVPMAILYYLEQFSVVPAKYSRLLKNG